MTQQQRSWTARLGEPKTLSDLMRAARDCMRDACECVPADCEHPHNRMTPLEFAEWIEREVHRAQQERAPLMVRQLHADRARERHDGPALRAVPA